MFQAENCSLNLPSGTVDYIRFGRGAKTLIMIPGVGDGLKTVKGILDKYDFISEKDKAIVCNGFIKFSDYGKLIDSLQQSVAVAQKTGKVKASAGAGCLIPILVIIALFMVLR